MFSLPDIPTLRLCSLLATSTFGAIFLALWARRRGETYLLHWGASAGLYAVALIGLDLDMTAPTAALASFCYGLVALSDVLLVSGMRRFDGKRPFQAWMVMPVVATMIGVGLPLAIGQAGPETAATSRVLGSMMLGGSIAVCAAVILSGSRGGEGVLPRQLVGGALLAYVPGYVISIGMEYSALPRSNVIALVPMVQDQVLLGILNLGLLATPWERALRQLKETALRDGLTRTWNRTAFKQRETALALPHNSVVLIDLDHFKRINDTFGHAAGDAVLIALASRAQALAEQRGGMLVRLGGDEFVLVAPTADDGDARALAEQVRAIPESSGAGLPPYSISVGLGRVRPGETGLSQAMARADRSLYRAKASGRDQVAA